MDLSVAVKTYRQTTCEIIKPLPAAPVDVMHLSRDIAAELAMEVLTQKGESQPAIFPELSLSQL